jgi:transaldolase
MKFFLDSATLGEIREAAELGLIDGVTTNPSLVAREGGVDFKRHIAAVCEAVAGPVSAVRPPLSRFDGRTGVHNGCRK